MNTMTEQNKAIVQRFNTECVEQGNLHSFEELLAPDCINHTAPAGSPNGRDGMIYFLTQILRKAFPDIRVIITDQIAEGDKVVSRKEFHGTHTGPWMDKPATQKKVVFNVIDIIQLRDGQYIGHWAQTDLFTVMAAL